MEENFWDFLPTDPLQQSFDAVFPFPQYQGVTAEDLKEENSESSSYTALEGSDLVESPQIQEWSVPAAPVYDESLVKQDPWEQSTFTFSFADLKAEPFAEVSEPRKIRRKEFNEVVARHIFHDLSAGMTYETAITKYSLLYPEFQTKFTVNFMGKLKNGHICNSVTGLPKRKVKSGDVRAPRHIPSPARQWERLTPELLEKIIYHVDVEGMRMADVERLFNVNRTTFSRHRHARTSKDRNQQPHQLVA